MTDQQDNSVEGARAAQARGELDAWVERFLGSDGSDNAELGEVLRTDMSFWYGPVELPFDELNRLAGPPDQPTLDRLDDDDLDTVEGMVDSLEDGWQPPPIIVSLNAAGEFDVEDGNHRIEGLRRSGRTRYWSIIGFEDDEQRRRFVDETTG